jgi:hypothetical protein
MSDIVERLRSVTDLQRETEQSSYEQDDELAVEAADTITALRAELHTASDMNDVYECRLQEKEVENEKLRATLKSIAANTYGYEPDVMSDEEAKNYFARLFFDAQNKARTALQKETNDGN